jgi:hypothetical protein
MFGETPLQTLRRQGAGSVIREVGTPPMRTPLRTALPIA